MTTAKLGEIWFYTILTGNIVSTILIYLVLFPSFELLLFVILVLLSFSIIFLLPVTIAIRGVLYYIKKKNIPLKEQKIILLSSHCIFGLFTFLLIGFFAYISIFLLLFFGIIYTGIGFLFLYLALKKLSQVKSA